MQRTGLGRLRASAMTRPAWVGRPWTLTPGIPRRRAARALAYGALVVMTFAVAAGFGYWKASPASPALDGGTVPGAILRAADDFDSRLGGAGISFEAVQQQTLHAHPGGSPLADPNAPSANPTDTVYMERDLSHGFAKRDVYYAEIRGGYAPDAPSDWSIGTFEFGLLIRDGNAWRNNDAGWLPASMTNVPGLGVDPFTLSKLGHMLRSLASVSDEGADMVNGIRVERYSGLADSAGWPGIIASDGLTFTSSPINVEVWLGPGDHLLRLAGTARNLNSTDADLIVKVDVTFGDQVPATLPEPSPLGSPDPGNVTEMR